MLPTENQRSASRSAAEGQVTADMLAQYAYCARRFHLVYVEGRWGDNAFTDEGRFIHRHVDADEQPLPDPADHPDLPKSSRSVSLTDEVLGLHAKADLVETRAEAGQAVAQPVETKRGAAPDNGAWEPEQVQLMAQGLVLRANGYACDRGFVYYAASRKRVEVAFTEALEARTRSLVAELHRLLDGPGAQLPGPLVDSPKCPGCSLAGICLPDETAALAGETPEPAEGEVRRLFPASDDAQPFYVQEQGAYLGKRGEEIYVSKAHQQLAKTRLKEVSQVVLCGNISISPAALHMLCEAGVPVLHLSFGHWFYGVTTSLGLRNAFDREAQFRRAADPASALELARAFVKAKVTNQRTLLRRNGSHLPIGPEGPLDAMADIIERVDSVTRREELLGVEGSAAAIYFRHFSSMIRPPVGEEPNSGSEPLGFDFNQRNRRPPRDPINALLSFGYAILAKECTVALIGAGLEPHWGFLHQPRHGRPALALDLMEEFRPLIVDSAVLTAINTGMVGLRDFVITPAGCALIDSGRKAFIKAYEARLDQLATHPVFDYRCSWRRLVAMQALLLSRVLRKDIPRYVGITTR